MYLSSKVGHKSAKWLEIRWLTMPNEVKSSRYFKPVTVCVIQNRSERNICSFWWTQHNTTQTINDLGNLKMCTSRTDIFSAHSLSLVYSLQGFTCASAHLTYLPWLQKLQEILMPVRSVMRVSGKWLLLWNTWMLSTCHLPLTTRLRWSRG